VSTVKTFHLLVDVNFQLLSLMLHTFQAVIARRSREMLMIFMEKILACIVIQKYTIKSKWKEFFSSQPQLSNTATTATQYKQGEEQNSLTSEVFEAADEESVAASAVYGAARESARSAATPSRSAGRRRHGLSGRDRM
jgi:hypothetical protein